MGETARAALTSAYKQTIESGKIHELDFEKTKRSRQLPQREQMASIKTKGYVGS
jgi:hypothetical protein